MQAALQAEPAPTGGDEDLEDEAALADVLRQEQEVREAGGPTQPGAAAAPEWALVARWRGGEVAIPPFTLRRDPREQAGRNVCATAQAALKPARPAHTGFVRLLASRY